MSKASKSAKSATSINETSSNTPVLETASGHDLAVKNAQKAVLKAAESGDGLDTAQSAYSQALAARKEFATKRLPLACQHYLDLDGEATDAQRAEAMKELRSALSALATVTTVATTPATGA